MKSAIVCGGGPSLKKFKHLEQIAKSDYKGTIILTDKVLTEALKKGITPKKFDVVIVSSEYGVDIHLHYFNDTITKKVKGARAWIYTPDNKVTEYLRECGVEVHTFDANNMDKDANNLTNVGAIAWVCAWKELFCDKIALVGMNQSYPVEWLKNFPKEYVGKFLKIRHSDVYNQDYVLDPLYAYYHEALLEAIQRKGVETWNCTGEGSIDHNCKIATLEEFLNEN